MTNIVKFPGSFKKPPRPAPTEQLELDFSVIAAWSIAAAARVPRLCPPAPPWKPLFTQEQWDRGQKAQDQYEEDNRSPSKAPRLPSYLERYNIPPDVWAEAQKEQDEYERQNSCPVPQVWPVGD